MGSHLVVSRREEGGPEMLVECIPGDLAKGGELGLRQGASRRQGWKIVYVEFLADNRLARLRGAWLQTAAGRAALDKALEADARGECACDDLLFGEVGWA
ncbi:MAG TPA: hypothetical protein VI643_06700 [Planctomycetota bacterium]|nr:hypothetical protein [Planctomycetota bacterium]